MHDTFPFTANPLPEPALRPVIASYIVSFLKPEMHHIHRQLSALGSFRPIVVTQKRENAERFPFSDVIVLRKPRLHALRRLWQKQILRRPITIYRWEAQRILRTLHEIGARALHVYFGHIGVHLLPLLERCDVPVLVSFHGADAQVDLNRPVQRERMQRVFARATLILVRSRSLEERLIVVGCDPGKIRLHRTGVPLDEITFSQRTAPPDGMWRCLQASRLIAKKGLPTTLRAFAKFAVAHPRATLTIAGEGPLTQELRVLASELTIGDRVFFTGFVSQEKLRALCAESHLFLHPSELGPDGDQEGVPNAMLEAMASGLPVAATRHGGIPEAVEDGVSGLLVDERDHEALSAAMLSLASDPVRYAEMSAAARRRVVSEFDIERQARVLEDLYAEAIAVGERSAPAP